MSVVLYNEYMNKKRLVIIILIVAAIVLTFIVAYFSVLQEKQPEIAITTPAVPTLPTTVPQEVKLVRITPNINNFETRFPDEPIVFTFNVPIKRENIKHTVTPDASVTLVTNGYPGNVFALYPRSGWKNDITYKVVVETPIYSISGSSYNEIIEFEFKRVEPDEEFEINIDESGPSFEYHPQP